MKTVTALSRSLVVAAAACAVLAGARPAAAQGFISPFIGYDFSGDSGCPQLANCQNKNLNAGASIGGLGRLFGSELEIGYASKFFGETPGVSSSVLTVMGNLMLAPKLGLVQPYALAGLGLMKTRVEVSSAGLLETSNNHLGWDVGGGAIIHLGGHVGVRGDIRYFHAFQDLQLLGVSIADAKLDFGRASAGLVLKF